jgi:hypothetical protein
MSCPNMTNAIENCKSPRKPYRGILTDTEKQRLKNGEINYHRQMKNIIKQKAIVAIIVDLPLILEKTDLRFELELTGRSLFASSTKILFNQTKTRLESQRAEKSIKRKVSNKQVWQQVAKELGNNYEF